MTIRKMNRKEKDVANATSFLIRLIHQICEEYEEEVIAFFNMPFRMALNSDNVGAVFPLKSFNHAVSGDSGDLEPVADFIDSLMMS